MRHKKKHRKRKARKGNSSTGNRISNETGLSQEKQYEILSKIIYDNLPNEFKERIGYVG